MRRWQSAALVLFTIAVVGAAAFGGIWFGGLHDTVFGGGGKTDIARLNAGAAPAIAYYNGDHWVQALKRSTAASCVAVTKLEYVDQVGCTIDTAKAGHDAVAYVGRPTPLGRQAYASYFEEFRKARAETAPVGEHPLLLVGKQWFVNGDDSALIAVQKALGGRLVRA